jgi:tetratricopeptide (TPR) repeat protein
MVKYPKPFFYPIQRYYSLMDPILERAAARRRGKWRYLAPVLCATLLFAGCSGLAEKKSVTPEPEAKPAQKLPDVALTPDLVYDILVGEIGRQRGDYGVSLDALMRAAKKTRDPRLIERAAQVAMYSHHTPQALEAAHLWVEVNPESRLAQEVLGATLLSAGDSAAAERHLKTALALYGDDLTRGYQRMSDVLSHVGRNTAALPVMEHLVALHPKLPEAYFYLAHTAARVRAPEKACKKRTRYRRSLKSI